MAVDTLRVGVAHPDPPFNGMAGGGGLDVDVINAIGANLGLHIEVIVYGGADFDGIFTSLAGGAYDCVIAGTTVTPERQRQAAFAPPYLISGQALAVDAARFPRVRSIDDLTGLTIGVEQDSTSQPIAERLVTAGRAGAVRVYAHGDMRAAQSDLASGDCAAFMKLAPALTELVQQLPDIDVVQRGISREEIAIAVSLGDDATLQSIISAQVELEGDGTLQGIRREWLGNPYVDQSLAAH